MFSLKGVAIGIGVAALLALVTETLYIHHQTSTIASVKQSNVELSSKVAVASSTIQYQSLVAKATNEVVSDTTKSILKNDQVKASIKQRVDNIAKEEKDETITSSAADAAYLNSMWSAYCTSGDSDSHCTINPSTGRSIK